MSDTKNQPRHKFQQKRALESLDSPFSRIYAVTKASQLFYHSGVAHKKPIIPQGMPNPTPQAFRKTVARNLKQRRSIAAMSQQELADRAAVSITTIQRIEYEEFHVRGSVLARIRRALGISWEDLMKGI